MQQLRWKVLFVALLMTALVGLRQDSAAQDPAGQPGGAKKQPDDSSLLLSEPKTPEELFKATTLMYRLARPNLARKYLQQLMDSKPDEATILQLRDKFGPSDFLRLSQVKELQPLANDLLDRVNKAFRKRGADPKYINNLLDGLEGTPAERDVAITTLRNTGTIVLPAIIQRMATAGNNKDRVSAMQNALIEFGDDAVPAVIAALDAPSQTIQMQAMTVLGLIGNQSAAPFLWGTAFDAKAAPGTRQAARQALARIYNTKDNGVRSTAPASVTSELRRLALQHFRGEVKWTVGADKQTELWTWKTDTVATNRVDPRFASLYYGTRFAKKAMELSPENRESQALFLALSLSAAADPAWEKPLPTGKGSAFDTALAAGTPVVNDALALSLKHNEPTAAIACLLVLRQIATKNDLASEPRSALMAAMQSSDHRVQFAAAVTVLNIDPDQSFRGVTRIVSILARALNDNGSPKGLVIHTSTQHAASLAGLLGQLGYEPTIAQTGRGGFKIASSRSDIDLVLMQINTIRWPLSQTLANFRADPRTAAIPIVIYGPEFMRQRVQRHLERYESVSYINEVTTTASLTEQLQPVLATAKAPPMSAKQRSEQRVAAAFWLAHIASGKRGQVYDLRPAESALAAALNDPALIASSLQALAAIPTKTAQQSLQSVVTNPNTDIKHRRTAAAQLAAHVQRYGLLLTTKQVNDLKQLHAATQDVELATGLSAFVGTLKPDAKRVGTQLQQIPLPMVPMGK